MDELDGLKAEMRLNGVNTLTREVNPTWGSNPSNPSEGSLRADS